VRYLRQIYSFLFYLILPFLFLRLLWRSRRAPVYRQRWAERLGYCPYRLEKSIWVHAVSVGETLAALPLIKALKNEYPHLPLLVTTMTPTGAARVKAAFGDTVFHAYIPYDLPSAVGCFLQRVKPCIGIIMETELWPNLFAGCAKRSIPLVVVNARLSAQSARGYQRISTLTPAMFDAIHAMAAQGQTDADRFIALGLAKNKITVTGSIKFDVEVPKDLLSRAESLRTQLGQDRFIWIAASTHSGEEEIMLAAHRLLQVKIPDALLILVPRHPERFDSIAQEVSQQGFSLARRSQQENCNEKTQVYLGDTMGELLLLYAVADVAVVAGSFSAIGGHNMLEAAAVGKPIITGPHLHNFTEISELLVAAKAMIKVTDASQLAEVLLQFFTQPAFRHETGQYANAIVQANRGALGKQLAVIRNSLTLR